MSRPVQTERLHLEPSSVADLELFVELDADPEVMRYLTGGRPTPTDEIAAMLSAANDQRWTVWHRRSGDFLGWLSLMPSGTGEAELGYRLRRDAWGQGYASEGSRGLMRFGFAELGLDRIWAQTMAINTASRRVVEACGLRHIRMFYLEWDNPLEGAELGEVEYEILRPMDY